jgi:hypothetical protein
LTKLGFVKGQDGTPLDHVSAAVQLSDRLGDHVIGHFVDQARRAGASWTEIGQSMGRHQAGRAETLRAQGSPAVYCT